MHFSWRIARGARTARRAAALVAWLAAGGCAGDSVTGFAPSSGQAAMGLYWGLTLDHQAVLLSTAAPYDELQLTATPRDRNGAPLAGLGPVTFTSADPERVQVTADGVVRALASASNIEITAELAAGNTRHEASVIVSVTTDDAPPVLTNLSFLLPPALAVFPMNGDGAAMSISGTGNVSPGLPIKLVPLSATDENSDPIPEIGVGFVSSDSAIGIALAAGGPMVAVFPKKPGRFTITASATAYGVTKEAALPFTITMPIWAVVKVVRRPIDVAGTLAPVFESSEVTVSPGGNVLWVNLSGEPVDVVFDDPTHVVEHGTISCAKARVTDPGGAGDLPAFGEPQTSTTRLNAENCRSRRFPVPGVYPYRSTVTGATGRVVVTDGLPES